MVPRTPLPNGLPCTRHLRQIIGIHLARVSFPLRSILTRLHVALLHSSLDTPGDLVGDLAHTMQQYISIAQQDAVMVVVPMVEFPEHLAIPVRFQDDATF